MEIEVRIQDTSDYQSQLLELFGSSISDGNRHDPDNLPILVGGNGGGQLRTGQHVAVEGMVPLCNLYLTMLQKMGLPIDQFGDSDGIIAGI